MMTLTTLTIRYLVGVSSRRALPDIARDLDELRRDMEAERPALAERLGDVADELRRDGMPEPAYYISTGEAAAALGVSPNTVKKWVRAGFIRDFWTLPGSGYLKLARSEIERIRSEGGRPTGDMQA